MNDTRLPSLDGLRAFSILLVVAGHAAGTVNAPQWLAPLHNLGNFGVKIFFVISGFLITHLLLEELRRRGTVSLSGFYLRRLWRIFPAFYAFVGCIALAAAAGWVELMPGDLLHAASYTMNYHHERAWWLNHTWSLAVEEQFYLLWPLALVALGAGRALRLAALLLLLVPLVRALMWYGLELSPSAMTREFQAVADALATGCLLAGVRRRGWGPPRWLRGSGFALVPVALFVVPAALYKVDPGLFYVAGQSIVNLAAAALVWRVVAVREGLVYRSLNSAPAVWLGGLSYSLYLWQEPFLNSWSGAWYATWPTNLLLAFACAVASHYLVERPLLRRRIANREAVVAFRDPRPAGDAPDVPDAPYYPLHGPLRRFAAPWPGACRSRREHNGSGT